MVDVLSCAQGRRTPPMPPTESGSPVPFASSASESDRRQARAERFNSNTLDFMEDLGISRSQGSAALAAAHGDQTLAVETATDACSPSAFAPSSPVPSPSPSPSAPPPPEAGLQSYTALGRTICAGLAQYASDSDTDSASAPASDSEDSSDAPASDSEDSSDGQPSGRPPKRARTDPLDFDAGGEGEGDDGSMGPFVGPQQAGGAPAGQRLTDLMNGCDHYPDKDCGHDLRCYPFSAKGDGQRRRTARYRAKKEGKPPPPGCGVGKSATRARTGQHVRKADQKVRKYVKRDRQHRRVNKALTVALSNAGVAVPRGVGQARSRGGGDRGGGGGGQRRNLTWVRGRQ